MPQTPAPDNQPIIDELRTLTAAVKDIGADIRELTRGLIVTHTAIDQRLTHYDDAIAEFRTLADRIAGLETQLEALDVVSRFARIIEHRDADSVPPPPQALIDVCNRPPGEHEIDLDVNGTTVHARVTTPCDVDDIWPDLWSTVIADEE